jgi:Uma2 family endonuclease
VEVLSPLPQDYDRGTKFTYSRSIPQLQEHILVDQYSVKIEQFSKISQGQWLLTEHGAEVESLMVESLKLPLSITDIYDQVEFESYSP